MNRVNQIEKIIIIAIIAYVGFSAHAGADRGMGYGYHHGSGQHMHGWHHGSYAGPGSGFRGELSQEEVEQLAKERSNFFEVTKDLRAKLYQKDLELRSELAKENLDKQEAARLQKEISELKAEFDQKRLEHFFNMKKINPDIGRSPRGSYGMMEPGLMGRWSYGGGYCPNCPYGDARGGYGMGRGMMGPGRGRSMEPHGSGRDYPRQSGNQSGSLEEKDAIKIVENYIKSTGNPNLKLGNITDAGKAFEVEIVTKDKSLVDKVLVDKGSGAMRSIY
jgi:hypothetical protein